MPADDVSDLRDVVDAINRLCDTMKTSYVAPCTDDHSSSDQTTDDLSVTELTDSSGAVSSDVSKISTNISNSVARATCTDTISSIMQPIENSAFVSNTLTQPATISTYDPSTSIFAKCVVKSTVTKPKNNAQSSSIQDVVSNTIIHQTQDSTACSSASAQFTLEDVITQPTEINTIASSIVALPTEDCVVSSSIVHSSLVPSNISQPTEADVNSSLDESVYEYRDIEVVSPEEVFHKVFNAERWSDTTSQLSPPGQPDDAETVTSDPCENAQFENASEMYYTASSEVSLLSDLELQEKGQEDDRKECVVHGHVAAMRERFESMTRTNTPCPDMLRSLSPSLEAFRNVSPSPDRLA